MQHSRCRTNWHDVGMALCRESGHACSVQAVVGETQVMRPPPRLRKHAARTALWLNDVQAGCAISHATWQSCGVTGQSDPMPPYTTRPQPSMSTAPIAKYIITYSGHHE